MKQLEFASPKPNLRIWFDGGCWPNPGTMYGSYEISGSGLYHKVSRQQFGIGTNNQAEYMALLCALEWAVQHADYNEASLEIWTDSNIVANQVSRRWKPSKNLGLRPLLDQVQDYLKPFRTWSIHWAGREANVERFGH